MWIYNYPYFYVIEKKNILMKRRSIPLQIERQYQDHHQITMLWNPWVHAREVNVVFVDQVAGNAVFLVHQMYIVMLKKEVLRYENLWPLIIVFWITLKKIDVPFSCIYHMLLYYPFWYRWRSLCILSGQFFYDYIYSSIYIWLFFHLKMWFCFYCCIFFWYLKI